MNQQQAPQIQIPPSVTFSSTFGPVDAKQITPQATPQVAVTMPAAQAPAQPAVTSYPFRPQLFQPPPPPTQQQMPYTANTTVAPTSAADQDYLNKKYGELLARNPQAFMVPPGVPPVGTTSAVTTASNPVVQSLIQQTIANHMQNQGFVPPPQPTSTALFNEHENTHYGHGHSHDHSGHGHSH